MLVLTWMDYKNKETLYNQARKNLEKCKGEQATGRCRNESSVAAVKLEPTFLAENEEAVWAAGSMRRGRLKYGSGRGRRRGGLRGRPLCASGRGPKPENDSAERENQVNPKDPDGVDLPQLWILLSQSW